MACEDRFDLADGVLYQMLGPGTQPGNDHHKIGQRFAVFILARRAFVQRVGW
jgi:hypothetical protein